MLNGTELNLLFSQVFGYSATESGYRIGFLVDVPTSPSEDTPDWKQRRELVMKWARALEKTSFHACFVYAYEDLGRKHVDLHHPLHCIALQDEIPDTLDKLVSYRSEVFEAEEIFSRAECWIAMTQYSALAPLKLAAAKYGFRAAVLSGFTMAMMPALSVDIAAVDARVSRLANALTRAQLVVLTFNVRGNEYQLYIDLRYRMAFASSGRFTNHGQAGTLPAGEAYIVPYESEKIGVVSMSDGILPLENNGCIALCEVSENRIVCIDGDNEFAESLRQIIDAEPAMANLAEFGLGILSEWGIEPVGINQHDKKTAPHIGFGRSEYLGGVTSPADFKIPASASHLEFVFHPTLMPDIHISRGILVVDDREITFMLNDKYQHDVISTCLEASPIC